MQKFYMMDTKMPIPQKESMINTLEDIREKNVQDIDTSYTSLVLEWADNEFQNIFKKINVKNKFDLNNVSVAFFQNDYFNVPEGFFDYKKNLLAIKIDSFNTGAESYVQQAALHELTHAATSSHYLVGVAVTEGIALYMEKLYYKNYDITFENEDAYDEGYIFSDNLINSIILNVYNNDLNLFFDRIKKGNEEKFLNDVDNYLKSRNIPYTAKELLRMSSILFYAKKIPNSPFEKYTKNDEMEKLRQEILECFDKENKNDNLVIYNFINPIKYICSLHEEIKNNLSNFGVVSTTLDRELGLAIVENGSSMLLDNEAVIDIIKKTFDITNTKEIDYNINHEDAKPSYPKK